MRILPIHMRAQFHYWGSRPDRRGQLPWLTYLYSDAAFCNTEAYRQFHLRAVSSIPTPFWLSDLGQDEELYLAMYDGWSEFCSVAETSDWSGAAEWYFHLIDTGCSIVPPSNKTFWFSTFLAVPTLQLLIDTATSNQFAEEIVSDWKRLKSAPEQIVRYETTFAQVKRDLNLSPILSEIAQLEIGEDTLIEPETCIDKLLESNPIVKGGDTDELVRWYLTQCKRCVSVRSVVRWTDRIVRQRQYATSLSSVPNIYATITRLKLCLFLSNLDSIKSGKKVPGLGL